MIMPYGRKATEAEPGKGLPANIDFNALWDHAYVPVIEALGYEPVRADQDSGALIIEEMLERLYFADLVLADMTIPNSNVYYEVGIRHAAKETGCVLLAADWSRQRFDVEQMRMVRYPLPEGDVTNETAEMIGLAIKDKIRRLAKGVSPMHQSIKGFPTHVDASAASTMKDRLADLAAFQGEIRAVRAVPRNQQMQRARTLIARYAGPTMTAQTGLGLLQLLRDCVESTDDWKVVLDFVDALPAELKDEEQVREQQALALSKAGKLVDAVAALEALVETSGPTPERLGLLGGRYKQLLKSADTPEDKRTCLNKAIDAYERGMELDLNDYYCSCNLPRLYRQRKRKGDEERAGSVLKIVIAQCERAKKRGVADEWLRPTLLGAAFDAGDAGKAEELAEEVRDEGAARWKLDSLMQDLQASIAHVEDDERRDRLGAVLAELRG
jgi:tetratricopeptide (TPR) repeat protein